MKQLTDEFKHNLDKKLLSRLQDGVDMGLDGKNWTKIDLDIAIELRLKLAIKLRREFGRKLKDEFKRQFMENKTIRY